MAEQPVEHTGQTAKDARPVEQVLREIRHQAEQHGQGQQHPGALTGFDPPPQLPEPHAVHRQMEDAEMHEHRREQPPPLPRCQRLLQRGEIDVLAIDAKIDEIQPADGREVIAELGNQRGQQRDNQHRRRERAGTQGCDETTAPPRRLRHRHNTAVGIARIEFAHLLDRCVRHPQHLLVALHRNPARHPQMAQQPDESAQILRQRQAQRLDHDTHVRNTAQTSTQANFAGSRRVS
ncbi:hypothetical protein SSTU70S_01906 [Stutzerimonas stutzeri]